MCHNRFQHNRPRSRQDRSKKLPEGRQVTAKEPEHFSNKRGQPGCAVGASRLKPDEVVGTDKSPRKYINNP